MKLKRVTSENKLWGLYSEAKYETLSGREYRVYFASNDRNHAPDHADHFLIIGVIQSFLLREPYSQDVPTSSLLVCNLRALLDIWHGWTGRSPISIHAPLADRSPSLSSPRSGGAFFSGGVDSLFTEQTLGSRLTHLISLEHRSYHEPDISEGFERLEELTPYVDATGRRHAKVVTNVMIEMPELGDLWAFLTHGGALASVGHLFSAELDRIVISSSHDYGHLMRWGSHPLTDQLFSSEFVQAEHYGAQYNRLQKTEKIAGSEEALSILSVCGSGRRQGRTVNCSRCQKCLRTMITLDLLEVDRSKAVTFDWSGYDARQFAGIYLRGSNEFIFAREILGEARARRRDDIAGPVGRAIRSSMAFLPFAYAETTARLRLPWVIQHKSTLMKLRQLMYGGLRLKRELPKITSK